MIVGLKTSSLSCVYGRRMGLVWLRLEWYRRDVEYFHLGNMHSCQTAAYDPAAPLIAKITPSWSSARFLNKKSRDSSTQGSVSAVQIKSYVIMTADVNSTGGYCSNATLWLCV